MNKSYKLINNGLGWFLGILASLIYIMTAEPTASWWDCGEYIATTYKLLVGHPPGAPTFQLFGKMFTLFNGGDLTNVAFLVNSMSAIASGMTIMLLFWTMTKLGKKLVVKLGGFTPLRTFGIFASATVGALTYTFSDTFWFSAVEGEVYAMSSFFTALVFWCILKWDEEYDNKIEGVNPNRWLILIFYLVGLSIGVHLLNLLTLPAIVLVVYFKLNKNATVWGVVFTLACASFAAAIFMTPLLMLATWVLVSGPLFYLSAKNGVFKSRDDIGVIVALGASVILLAVILYGIIPGIVNWAGKFEIFTVNAIGLPFNFGTVIYFLAIIGLIGYGLFYATKKNKRILQMVVYSFMFLLIGYSTFLTLVIRSNANPTIDENNPEDAVQLLSYLNREQYGTNPLFYGQTFNSGIVGIEDGDPVRVRNDEKGEYVVSNDKKQSVYIYDANSQMFFPRMWSSDKKGVYINWLKGEYDLSSAKDKQKISNLQKGRKPTWGDNTTFLRSYQFDYMYFRYFMWNFSGRQNDLQGRGDMYNGNWISGIPFIDNMLVGNQSDLPAALDRPGNNKYYMLPFLLGMIGLIWYSKKDGKNSFVVGLLFVMTGLAIAFYLNMYAFQPRERDYAFAASFYAFSIWVGFGVFALISLLEKINNNKVQVAAGVLVSILCIGLVPGIMAQQNWDDHDRSHRYTAVAIAKNYLDSCEPNAIIFTLGDNDTFPLWYVQEVEGYRTDVRVCNLSLFNAQWYIDQMKQKAYQSEPLPITFEWEQYKDGTRDQIIFSQANGNYVDLKQLMDYIKQPALDQRVLIFAEGYQQAPQTIPASFSINVDKEKVLANGTVALEDSALIVDKVTWNLPGQDQVYVIKAYIMMMDILANNNWERPIYFASTIGSEGFFGLENYFQLEGLAYRLVPIRTTNAQGYLGKINTEKLYNNVMVKFNDHSRVDKMNNPEAKELEPYPYLWGGINDPRVYNNEDNTRLFPLVRQLHQRLADNLKTKGDLERAEAVLDHGNELLNNDVIPYITLGQLGNMYNSLAYLGSYFSIGTPSATEKGIEMASAIMATTIEAIDWLNASNERTRVIHAENIEHLFVTLSQVQTMVPFAHQGQLAPSFKDVKMGKVGEDYMNVTVRKLKNAMKDLNNEQDQLVDAFRNLKTMKDFAELTGDAEYTSVVNNEIETGIANLRGVSPELADAVIRYIFPANEEIASVSENN